MSDSQSPEYTPKPNPTGDRPSSRPPGTRDSSAHLHAALSASGRAEASLSTLMRAIRDLSSGVSGAREANLQLLRELESMSDLLGAANERQLALKNRISLLEQSLERAHVEAQRERAYILDQQDAFIAAMMEDHEQVIRELHRELETARNRPSQRPTAFPDLPQEGPEATQEMRSELAAAQRAIEKLVGERDRARETLLKVQAQRDEAQAALVDITREPSRPPQPRISQGLSAAAAASNLRNAPTLPPPDNAQRPLSVAAAAIVNNTPTAPPPAPLPEEEKTVRTTAAQVFGAIRPRAPDLELTPREVPDRMSQPPEELRAAVHAPASISPQGDKGIVPKRSFTPPGPPSQIPHAPAASGRPGGYSLTNSVAPENVAGAPRISRGPRS
jgi:hypothetical protein